MVEAQARRRAPVELIYFRDGNGAVRTARPGADAKPENIATLPFKVKMTIRAEEEFTEMFDQSWRYLAENFYDNKFHGSNWDAVREQLSAAGQARHHEGGLVRSALSDDGRTERLAPGHLGTFRIPRSRPPTWA